MKKKERVNILATHAEQLNRGEVTLTAKHARETELEPLLAVATAVHQTLTPVKPDPTFREELRHKLVTGSFEPESNRTVLRHKPFWLSLAAAGSLLSVVGLILYLFRRSRPEDASPLQSFTPSISVSTQ